MVFRTNQMVFRMSTEIEDNDPESESWSNQHILAPKLLFDSPIYCRLCMSSISQLLATEEEVFSTLKYIL